MKPVWQSKTVWFNVLSSAAVILALPDVLGVLPADWVPAVVAVTAAINVILRIGFTTQPTSLTGDSE